jgi:glycosyltransferase involved in cell wall biosynthesis
MLHCKQMKEDSPYNFGHEYTMALCSAIEKVTASEEAKNPKVFIYNGLNLRYAIERSFYFSYANHNGLFGIFTRWKTDRLEMIVHVKNNVEKKIAANLCNLDENQIQIQPESLSKKIKFKIKFLVQWLLIVCGISRLTSYIRRKINILSQRGEEYDVLFYVINERFVRFMRPIFGEMPVSCAYITHDRKAADYLEREKLPFIKISRFGHLIRQWSQKDSWLKQFLLIELYDQLCDSIERIRPKTIVMVEGSAPQYEVVNQLSKKCNIRSICLQQGWAPFVHTGFRNMTFSQMLVWGEGFAKDLKPYNHYQNFITTGSYTVETKILKRVEKINTISFFSQGKTFFINDSVWQEFITLAEQIALQCKEVEVIMREHPLYPLSYIEKERLERVGVIFMSPPKYSLDEVFQKSDLTVSIFSSAILESIAAGILPIVFNPKVLPKFYPDITALGVNIEVNNIKEAIQEIIELVKNPTQIEKFREPMENFREKYFAYNKEKAIQNIIKEII